MTGPPWRVSRQPQPQISLELAQEMINLIVLLTRLFRGIRQVADRIYHGAEDEQDRLELSSEIETARGNIYILAQLAHALPRSSAKSMAVRAVNNFKGKVKDLEWVLNPP